MKDTDQEGWKIAKALGEIARPPAKQRTKTFEKDSRYLRGLDRWPTPNSWKHAAKEEWKAKTPRNYLWQIYSFKRAVVLDTEPSMHAEPMSDDVQTVDLEHAKNVVKHERDRIGMPRIRGKMYFDGTVCGKGITHFYAEKDDLSGEYSICAERVDMRRFAWDPSADCLEECGFVQYFPELDYSKVLQLCELYGVPEKAPKIKSTSQVTDLGQPFSETRSRSNDELVYSSGTGVAVVEKNGQQQMFKAEVEFTYIKSNEITEYVQEKILQEQRPGLRCQDCNSLMEPGAAMQGAPMMDAMGNEMPPAEACPDCGSPNLAPETIPAKTDQETVISRKYPYGRLIIRSGDVLIYDGPAPLELEGKLPFAEYAFDPIPGDFLGFSDVDALKSTQMVLDKNMAMMLDAQRMTSMGVFEYPIGAEGYSQLGTAPGQSVPVPPELSGMARPVTVGAYNDRLHSVLDEMGMRDLQRISGISDISTGMAPTAPTSGVEVQARQRAAATRIGQHMKAMSKYDTDSSNIIFQMMRQLYKGPRTFQYDMSMAPTLAAQQEQQTGQVPSDYQAIALDVSTLPPGIMIRMTADPDDIQKDQLEGQNVGKLITDVFANPMVLQSVAPYLAILLPSFGIKPQKAKELQNLVATQLQNTPPPGPPPPPPPDPAQVLIAISDLVKANVPVAINQIEAALMAAGLPPPQGPVAQPPPPPQPRNGPPQSNPTNGGEPQ